MFFAGRNKHKKDIKFLERLSVLDGYAVTPTSSVWPPDEEGWVANNMPIGCGRIIDDVVIEKMDGHPVFYIDGLAFYIVRECGENCFLANQINSKTFGIVQGYLVFETERGQSAFHRIRERAESRLKQKYYWTFSVEERIAKFCRTFDAEVPYPAYLFFEWHSYILQSCYAGRHSFISKHSVLLDEDYYTVEEFLTLAEEDTINPKDWIWKIREWYTQN